MILPADFDWRHRWPVGTRLVLGHHGPGTVTEHTPTGLTVACDEPHRFGEGQWRAQLRFEDITREAAQP